MSERSKKSFAMGVGESRSIDDFQKFGWMKRSATLSSSVAKDAIISAIYWPNEMSKYGTVARHS